jgi:hypothetical protein
MVLSGSSASFATPQFLASTSRGVWIIQSDNSVVSSSENLPSSNTRRNSQPSGPSPCSECGTPVGKYQRSPAVTSPTNVDPSKFNAVSRQLPLSISAHSSALCQWSSRMPPAVSRMFTPAISVEIGKSCTFTWRDQPPSWTRRCIMENELQNICGNPRSVGGGVKLFGLSAFSASFSGPGSLALALASPIRTFCGCCAFACCPAAKAAPATAIVVVPRSRRREKIPPTRLNPFGRPASSSSDMKISFADPLERVVVLGRSVGPGGATLRCIFYAEVTETDLSTMPGSGGPP